MTKNWPFDQDADVAAITSRQVLREGLPILQVVHYDDDHSWGFTCGTTDDPMDGLVAGMGEIVDLDQTVLEVADLPPGWSAWRQSVGSPWHRHEAGAIKQCAQLDLGENA